MFNCKYYQFEKCCAPFYFHAMIIQHHLLQVGDCILRHTLYESCMTFQARGNFYFMQRFRWPPISPRLPRRKAEASVAVGTQQTRRVGGWWWTRLMCGVCPLPVYSQTTDRPTQNRYCTEVQNLTWWMSWVLTCFGHSLLHCRSVMLCSKICFLRFIFKL